MTSYTAPAHPHATGVFVYPALFLVITFIHEGTLACTQKTAQTYGNNNAGLLNLVFSVYDKNMMSSFNIVLLDYLLNVAKID